ncbi:MAG: aspartate aminotransferase family protein [Hyphomicrobiaceae bacterium]|nr:aspartate aminotransferase family protein [Hyphomicrobiaceae bacterium]
MTDSALFTTYARAPLAFERGEGAYLWSTDGRRYLDFMAGIAVNALGHAHPHLVEAVKSQAEKLWHVSNIFQIPDGERLAERLCEATFADRVFFTNSGAEAVEAAIKTARRYHFAKGQPERTRIVTVSGAFHGRTLATIAAGGQEKYLEGFGPKAPGFEQVAYGDDKALEHWIADPETAAVLIEPVQGEGGVRAFPLEVLKDLRRRCDETGVLLVLDEVQTGVGRTGHLFAHEAAGITPDIMAVAKGIGGGFPVGACLATAEAASGMVPGTHGSTFGGNPMAMAVANAVLDVVLDEDFLPHVRRVAGYLNQRLGGLVDSFPDVFADQRGTGLILGLKAKLPNTEIIAAAREEGLLVAGAGDNVVRLLPPLIITEAEVDAAVDLLERAAARVRAAHAAKGAA